MIFKIFDNKNIINKINSKNNYMNIILSKTKDKVIITANSFCRLIFSIKKRILAQITISKRLSHNKLKIWWKFTFF